MSLEPARPVRLAIVNDYEIVVAGLAAMLSEHRDRVHVAEIGVRLPVVSDVDLVLVDTFGRVQADGGVGEIVRRTAARVVLFSWDLPRPRVDRAIAQGAAGYVSKASTAEEIVVALEAVRDGRTVIAGGPEGAYADRTAVRAWPGQAEGLTPREAEVLAFVTQGLSNQEIAARAYLSINSVKTYIRSAYRKIGATRRAQAVSWGMRNGFEPVPCRVIEPAGRGPGTPAGEILRNS